MKKSLASLLNPHFDHYRSIGEMARTLQFLFATAEPFNKRGETGPADTLADYSSCINGGDRHWHTSRINAGSKRNVTTWQENHDSIYSCILAALCCESKKSLRWRAKNKISLGMMLKFPMRYQNQDDEIKAWEKLMELQGLKLPVSTLNHCHRSVNVLTEPQLFIGKGGIVITCEVTQRGELRQFPATHSRWDVCFLLRDSKEFSRAPRWVCQRETFAEFILRAVNFYKSVKPLDP